MANTTSDVAEPRGAQIDPSRADTVRRLRSGTDVLTTATQRRLDSECDWYRRLPAEDRSWLGLVAASGVAAFIDWYERPAPATYNAAEIFKVAPPELTESISLQHVLQLVRVMVEVVEHHTFAMAPPGGAGELREAALVYSREVAFSAAEVYARAAEARGAWDARMEALVVDSLLRGEQGHTLRSRIAALGWSHPGPALVMAGTVDLPFDERGAAELRRSARRAAADALVGIQGEHIIVVLGGDGDLRQAATELVARFGPGPVVIGPAVPDVSQAGQSARIALAGLTAAKAWPEAPRPVLASDLLPERTLVGDPEARRQLVDEVYRPLAEATGPLAQTLSAYLDTGRSLEAAARTLFVHPNTVRYRLRRICDLTGWDPADPREGLVLQLALLVGRLDS